MNLTLRCPVQDHAQCRYFAYSKTGSSAAGHCYYERTTDACQTEGYHYTYKYDFYDTLYIYTSIGNGVPQRRQQQVPAVGWVVGSFTTVRAACNADQYCLGYWCAHYPPPPAIDGKSPRVDLAGCIRRTRRGAGTGLLLAADLDNTSAGVSGVTDITSVVESGHKCVHEEGLLRVKA